jgi:hypothetical protein
VANVALIVLLLALIGWAMRRRRGPARPSSPRAELPGLALGFLDLVDGSLELPDDTRAEIRAELEAHLADSIAAIEAEGLDERAATREALARLGSPEELARQMRRAHQTTRRLLAGAAGGIFQAAVGAVEGYVAFGIVLFCCLVVGQTSLRPAINFMADHLPRVDQRSLATTTAFAAAVASGGLFAAGRRSVKELAARSRHTVGQVALPWAVGGFFVLAGTILFVNTAEQSWLVVPLELLIPFSFAAGVLVRMDRPLIPRGWHVPPKVGYAIVLGLPAVLVASAALGSTSTPTPRSDGYSFDTSVLDRVAPPSTTTVASFDGIVWGQPRVQSSWTIADAQALALYRDVRFEAWRGTLIPGESEDGMDYLPDYRYSGPFATSPAAPDGTELLGSFDLSHARTTRWAIFLTGVGPDGVRYRLSGTMPPESVTTYFSGTVWDWLTASA